MAEGIEGGAAQAPEGVERLERWTEPRAELELLLEAEGPEQRRVQMPEDLDPGTEARVELGLERGVQVQARHLVLVLVRHQLVEMPRHRLGEPGAPRHRLDLGL